MGGDEAQQELPNGKPHEHVKRAFHKSVAVEADAQHICAKPRPRRDHIAEDGQRHEAAVTHQAAQLGVQQEDVPDHDQQRAVFLGVPAPKPPPRLVRPNAAEHRAHKTEERGESNDAIYHPGDRLAIFGGQR